MQLMESTAIEVAVKISLDLDEENLQESIIDIDNNINLGTKYLSSLLEKYDNIALGVAAYNAGTGTVDKWIENGIINSSGSDIENIPYSETNTYVRKVLRDYQIYLDLYEN